MPTSFSSAELKAQHEYTEAKKRERFDYTLVVGEAFVRGIRDLGYKSTPNALNELIDNSMEAGASTVAVVFGFDKSDAKPTSISVLDDGHGMEPDMIRLAVMWGGTHRENSRSGWGRYGYGLPSASVSIGRRFSVFSKTSNMRNWQKVSIDLDEIAAGRYTKDGQIVVPEPEACKLPESLKKEFEKRFEGSEHGTVVVIEKLDRIDYKGGSRLQAHLLQNLGTTYRNRLRTVRAFVNDVQVEPVDPLFLMPEGRFHDLDEDRAEPYPAGTIDVRPTDSLTGGQIRVRYSYLPPTFQRKNKQSKSGASSNMNERFAIMKENNGFIVLRNGRQIDIVTKNPWTVFLTWDRNMKVELDFDATLDEEFGVTTSKQQITLSERMWNILKEHRVEQALDEMRARNRNDRAKETVEEPASKDQKRPSEIAMEAAQTILKRSIAKESVEKEIASQRNLDREIRRRAEEAQVAPAVVEEAVKKEVQEHPFRLVREASPEGPFYRVKQIGSQTVVYLNTAHRFFTDLYAGPKSNPALRAALEVMLFAIGGCELDAAPDFAKFYQQERHEWSRRLDVALGELDIVIEVHAEEEHDALST